jgi:hypothetical protein
MIKTLPKLLMSKFRFDLKENLIYLAKDLIHLAKASAKRCWLENNNLLIRKQFSKP